MPTPERAQERLLLEELSRLTNEYATLYRQAVQDAARARAELGEARQVLGMVAHDLRAPLTVVTGVTELLTLDPLSDEQRGLVRKLQQAAETMTALTGDLVDAVSVGNAPMASAPVDVAGLADMVVSRYQLLHPPERVRLRLRTVVAGDQGPALRVVGDRAKLERMLENLVSNAVKFSPPGGTVSVEVAEVLEVVEQHGSGAAAAGSVLVTVADQGPGIAPEDQEAVFAPFHRAPGAATVPGVGLGLAIVRQVAQRHGGSVTLESPPGQGAVFAVRLPAVRVGADSPPERGTAPDAGASEAVHG